MVNLLTCKKDATIYYVGHVNCMAKKDNEVWNLVCGFTMFLEIVQYLFASFHSISFLFIFTILLT